MQIDGESHSDTSVLSGYIRNSIWLTVLCGSCSILDLSMSPARLSKQWCYIDLAAMLPKCTHIAQGSIHNKAYTSTHPTPLHRQWTFIARHCRWCSTSQLINITYTPYSPLWGWMGNGYLDGGHACSGEHGCPSTGSHVSCLADLLFFFFSTTSSLCSTVSESTRTTYLQEPAWEPL